MKDISAVRNPDRVAEAEGFAGFRHVFWPGESQRDTLRETPEGGRHIQVNAMYVGTFSAISVHSDRDNLDTDNPTNVRSTLTRGKVHPTDQLSGWGRRSNPLAKFRPALPQRASPTPPTHPYHLLGRKPKNSGWHLANACLNPLTSVGFRVIHHHSELVLKFGDYDPKRALYNGALRLAANLIIDH